MIAYYQPHTFTTRLRGQAITVHTRRGLPHWNKITPAEELLAEHAAVTGRALLLGCHHGALAAVLARSCQLTYTDETITALQLTAQTLDANGLNGVSTIGGSFPFAVIQLPKGRKLGRRWLYEAHQAIQPGGVLYLAGANGDGIQSVLKDASELFGTLAVLGYKKGNRVGKMIKTGNAPLPEWARQPGIDPASWVEFNLAPRPGLTIKIRSRPGVFSYDRLDEGTALLLEHLSIPQGSRVLDFGCGYGVLGIAASRLGAGSVIMVDSALAAIASAQENLRINGVANGQIIACDGLESLMESPQVPFDLIISNPPFHTGQAVDYDVTETFLAQAWKLMAPGGRLLLVANRFIRYEKLLPGRVETLAATGKFHIIQTTKE